MKLRSKKWKMSFWANKIEKNKRFSNFRKEAGSKNAKITKMKNFDEAQVQNMKNVDFCNIF